MKAHQLIQNEAIQAKGYLNFFLRRVYEGIRDDITINEKQKQFILHQISWYGTVAEPRAQSIGTGVPGEVETSESYQRWLKCPNTVNSFVSAINSLGSK